MALIKQYLRYQTPAGEIAIEAADDEGAQGVQRTQTRDKSFEAAIGSVKAVADTFAWTLAEVKAPLESATLELALKFTAGAGVVFTTLKSDAQMKLTLTWKGTKRGPAKSGS